MVTTRSGAKTDPQAAPGVQVSESRVEDERPAGLVRGLVDTAGSLLRNLALGTESGVPGDTPIVNLGEDCSPPAGQRM